MAEKRIMSVRPLRVFPSSRGRVRCCSSEMETDTACGTRCSCDQ